MRGVRNLGEIQGSNFSSIAGFGLKFSSECLKVYSGNGSTKGETEFFGIAHRLDLLAQAVWNSLKTYF